MEKNKHPLLKTFSAVCECGFKFHFTGFKWKEFEGKTILCRKCGLQNLLEYGKKEGNV